MMITHKKYRVFLLVLMGLNLPYAHAQSGSDSPKQMVIDLLEQQQWQAAVDTLKTMRLQRLEDPELYYLFGKANSKIADLNNAEIAFKMALYFKKDYPEANYELGQIKLNQNLPGEAIFFYDQALRMKPDWHPAKRRLGEAYYLVGKYDQALDAFNSLIKLLTNDFESYYFVGLIRFKQDLLDAAVWNLQECLKIAPDYMPALQFLSRIYLQSDLQQDALPLFDTIFNLAPDSLKNKIYAGELYFQRARLMLAQDSFNLAITDLRKVLTLAPRHPLARDILEEITRKQNYDSLMQVSLDTWNNQNWSLAQNNFSRALLFAQTETERDSVNFFIDSLTVMLSTQKVEDELSSLDQQAQAAFARGQYEQALTLYQKVILLNPADQASETAFRETGSLKYFIQAIHEWDNENWDAAQKSFEHVLRYYPNFPGIRGKRQALQRIEQIESQQTILNTAIENSSYRMARELFTQLFRFDSNNPKFYETWFQILQLGSRSKIQTALNHLPLCLGVLILIILFLSVLFKQQWKERFYFAGALCLVVVPTVALVLAFGFLTRMQKATEVDLEITTEHASFVVKAAHSFTAEINSDSIVFPQIHQIAIKNCQLDENKFYARIEPGELLTVNADSLAEPLKLYLGGAKNPVKLKNCCFSSPGKVVVRSQNSNSYLSVSPQTIDETQFSGSKGTLVFTDEFKLELPAVEKIIKDSTGQSTKVIPRELVGKPLAGSIQANFETGESTMQMIFKQPAGFQFGELPVKDLSLSRFLPGDSTVKITQGLKNVKIIRLAGASSEFTGQLFQRFHVFPNRFSLRSIENQGNFLRLSLTGIFENLQLSGKDSGEIEIIPSYLAWLWGENKWVIFIIGLTWLILFIPGLMLLFNSRGTPGIVELTEVSSGAEPVELPTLKNALQPIHLEWQFSLAEKIIPQWEAQLNNLEKELRGEKTRRRRKEIAQQLNQIKSILNERKTELNTK